MKLREPYKGYIIEAMSLERSDGQGFVSDLFIENHGGEGVTVTQFGVPGTFSTKELAIQNAVVSGRRKIDVGFAA